MLAGNINHGTCFNVDRLGISLVLDLRTGFQFRTGEDAKLLKERYGLLFRQHRNGVHHGLDIRKAHGALPLLPTRPSNHFH